MKYYKVIITMTSKNAGRNNEGYNTYDNEIMEFKTVKECKDWLSDDRYYSCKKTVPMYRDDKDGNAIKIGKIYCYKDKNYDTGKTILCQDWTEIREVKEKTVKF